MYQNISKRRFKWQEYGCDKDWILYWTEIYCDGLMFEIFAIWIVCVIFAVCLKSLVRFKFSSRLQLRIIQSKANAWPCDFSNDFSMTTRSSNDTSHYFHTIFWTNSTANAVGSPHQPFSFWNNFDQGTLHQVLGELQPFPKASRPLPPR